MNNETCTCRGAKNYKIKCPLVHEFQIIGKKWSVPILTEINKNRTIKFSEIRKSLNPITSKMLAKRLKELENNMLVEKRITKHNKKISTDYMLTAKGNDLINYLFAFRDYSIKWADSKDCRIISQR